MRLLKLKLTIVMVSYLFQTVCSVVCVYFCVSEYIPYDLNMKCYIVYINIWLSMD